MTNSEKPPPPALVNVTVKTQQDALRILQAVLAGDLEECPRRMGEHGPRVICPGDVFVFMEGGLAGITRWTDGLKDKSGSRRRGPAGAHTTCYIIYEPPPRLGIPPDVEWVRKVWKIRCQMNGNDTVWSIVAYDFEGKGDHPLRTVQEALSSLVLPVPPPPPPPPPAPAPPPPPPTSPPVMAPIQPAMLNMDGIQNAQGESLPHLQNVEDHSEHPSSQTPSPVVEFRRPLFIQSAASTSSALSVTQAATPRRETLPSMASLQLPRPRVIPFVECAPHATRAAERTPEDARFLALFR